MIRVACPADAPAIARLEATAGATTWSEAQVRDTLSDEHARGWVDDAPGHLLARCAGGDGEILTVAVHPEARRRGAGRALVTMALDWWRQSGVAAGFLEVADDNAAARSLYASMGFVEVGRRRRYYRNGQDAVVMRWLVS